MSSSPSLPLFPTARFAPPQALFRGSTPPIPKFPAPSDRSLANYLTELVSEQSKLEPIRGHLHHAHRLVQEETDKVRSKMLEMSSDKQPVLPLPLPEPNGEVVSLTKKLFIPKKDFPDFNFIGRILGPRGATIKQLERETACQLAIRGRGSGSTAKVRANDDEPHVLITAKDTRVRAQMKLDDAVNKISPLLVPVAEEEDELKKSQLMELAVINGTYREMLDVSAVQQISPYYVPPVLAGSGGNPYNYFTTASPFYSTQPSYAVAPMSTSQPYYLCQYLPVSNPPPAEFSFNDDAAAVDRQY